MKVVWTIAIAAILVVLVIFGVSVVRGHPNLALLAAGAVGVISLMAAKHKPSSDDRINSEINEKLTK